MVNMVYRGIERSAIIGFHQFDSPFQHIRRDLFSERIFPERICHIFSERIVILFVVERIRRIISERIELSAHFRLFRTFLNLKKYRLLKFCKETGIELFIN